jgi:hypothetical protein
MSGACKDRVHLTVAARELDLVVVQEVRWHKGGIVKVRDYNIYGKGKEKHQVKTEYFVQHRIVLAVKRVEYVSDRIAYVVLRGRWCNIIALNVNAPSEEKSDNSRDSM